MTTRKKIEDQFFIPFFKEMLKKVIKKNPPRIRTEY